MNISYKQQIDEVLLMHGPAYSHIPGEAEPVTCNGVITTLVYADAEAAEFASVDEAIQAALPHLAALLAEQELAEGRAAAD